MKLLDKLAGRLGYRNREQVEAIATASAALAIRSFGAAQFSRLTNDWLAGSTNADAQLRGTVKTLRDRCRDLEQNNDYVRRYFKLLQNNVLGHCGIGLQMKVREAQTRKNGQITETYDVLANRIIEMHWQKWSTRENASVTGQYSFMDIQNLALRSVARDGAVLLRKHYPQNHPYHFALEPIEIDRLDVDYTQTGPNASLTKLGVEYDAAGRVAAYQILRYHPGEVYGIKANGMRSERVPAAQIIHLFNPERIGQSTGFPWLVSSMMRLKHLGAYEESEVVAARVAAAKMGFLKQTGMSPQNYAGAEAADGSRYMETEPGVVEKLPLGMEFQAFDPTHPTTAFADFVKATLRGISSGLGVSYTSLANDLEGVNYSSIRAGLLEEREEWKCIQNWLIEWFIRPVFEEWLELSLAAGALKDQAAPLPAAKFDKFNQPEFKPRRWDWVDPLKDLQASVLAVEKGFESRRSIIAERGGDIEDVFQDQSADQALEEQYGLDFDASDEAAAAASTTPKAPDGVDV